MAEQPRMAPKPGSVRLSSDDQNRLYAAGRYLTRETRIALNLLIPFEVYFKDPLVSAEMPGQPFDKDLRVPWEPGISDGPTSARFAVVDYDSTTNSLAPTARWDRSAKAFFGSDGSKLNSQQAASRQFRQVSTWAILQNTLDFYESGFGLGRRILWGFAGNRLIVVPQAGYGENAYYDRQSKSLQFYYFDNEGGERIYTCLSSDIVNHEFGHALLDGIRPHFIEAVSPETAAFHEFIGDLNALLMTLRNRTFRIELARRTAGDLTGDNFLARLAEQFGSAVSDRNYLRSAANNRRMEDWHDDLRPHELSQVLTGAVFDIICMLCKGYLNRRRAGGRPATAAKALAATMQRIQTLVIQPLDLLPPVEVTFADFARAVLRALEISNPTDPQGYRAMLCDIFRGRGILEQAECDALLKPHEVFQRLDLRVFHDIERVAGSRAEAYRFLDDNRHELRIPREADFLVADVFIAEKLTFDGRRQPLQILIQYVWREDMVLEGAEFGRFTGQTTSLLCGATLAMDENGNVLAWARKPGSQPINDLEEQAAGQRRRKEYLRQLGRRIRAGLIGQVEGGSMGLLGGSFAPMGVREIDGTLRFELTPHLGINHDGNEGHGGRPWQISS